MKKQATNEKLSPLDEFVKDVFHLYDKVIAILSIVLGIVILYFSLLYLTEKPKPIRPLQFAGTITLIELHTNSKSNVKEFWLRLHNDLQPELDTITFVSHKPEAVMHEKFKNDGGKLGDQITIITDSSELNAKFKEMEKILYNGNNYMDEKILASSRKSNLWWMFSCGVTLIVVGVLIFFLRRLLAD